MFLQLDLFRSLKTLFHHLILREASLPLVHVTILQMERLTQLLFDYCKKGEMGSSAEPSGSFSRFSSSLDSYETAASFLPAVRPLIDSLMTFFFSTLELLSSSAYLGFITADVVKHTVHALQLLLPFGECVVSEWGRVLMQCSNASNEQAQIEILKAVQVLIGMITSERDHDYCVIADEVVDRKSVV